MDNLLQNMGLTYDDLTTAERGTLHTWLDELSRQEITVSSIQEHIKQMKEGVERELTARKEVVPSWLTFLSYFIPFVGLIRKWYQDQNELGMKMRLRNYLLLEDFLFSPIKAKKSLEMQLQRIGKSKGESHNG